MKKIEIELIAHLSITTLALIAAIVLNQYHYEVWAMILCMVSIFSLGMFTRTAVIIEKRRNSIPKLSVDEWLEKEAEERKHCEHPGWVRDQYQ